MTQFEESVSLLFKHLLDFLLVSTQQVTFIYEDINTLQKDVSYFVILLTDLSKIVLSAFGLGLGFIVSLILFEICSVLMARLVLNRDDYFLLFRLSDYLLEKSHVYLE